LVLLLLLLLLLLRAVQVVVNTPSRSYTVAQLQQLMTDIGDQQAVSRHNSALGACSNSG
jgi:hypothetical protein